MAEGAVTQAAEKTRVPLAVAEAFATAAVALLEPSCTRIAVAGSIRRRKPDVGDVELVCIAKTAPAGLDLFGAGTGERDLLHERCEALLAAGVFAHRLGTDGNRAFGAKFKRLTFTHEGTTFPLDVFVASPSNWGAVFTIRTGSSGFTHRLVMHRHHGGGMPFGMQQRDGALWAGDRLVPTPEEEDYFRELGLVCPPPERRTDDAPLRRR